MITPETSAEMQSQGRIIYADDTDLLLQDEKTVVRIEHYSIITKSQECRNTIAKVELLTKNKNAIIQVLKPHLATFRRRERD